MKKLLILLAALTTVSAYAEKLVIKGSDTLGAKLVPQLIEEYKSKHPDVQFDLAAEGSTTGITAITDGTAQIAMSSRKAKPQEISAAQAKGVNMTPTTVAYDGIAIVVNEKNPITNLTKRQVEQLFTGEANDWSAVGGNAGSISIYTRNTASGTYSDFKELAMRKHDYAGSAQMLAGNEQIVSEVAKNPNGIGYVGLAYTTAPGVKVVSIDGAVPDNDSVHTGKYAYSRATFFYTNGEPTGEAKNFVEFTLSDEGQKIAKQVGFVPLPKK